MATQINTLYPPQVNTFMPAFARLTKTKDGNTEIPSDAVVYYSLSPYNSTEDIHFVHVSVVDQKTNENALTTKTGIYIAEFNPKTDFDQEMGMYKVVIPNSIIRKDDPKVAENESEEDAASKSNFKLNQYYKVQLRFDLNANITINGIEDGSVKGKLASFTPDVINLPSNDNLKGMYLIQGRANFSEWSTVCFIRCIANPQINLVRLQQKLDSTPGRPAGFNKGIIPVVGSVEFLDPSETEIMSSYKIQLLDSDGKKVILETDSIFTGNTFSQNSINYKFDIGGVDTDAGTNFILRVNITTKSQYETFADFPIAVVEYIEDEYFKPSITVEVDNDDAIAHVHVVNKPSVFGTLYVKRTSSVSNYRIWEDVYVVNVNGPIDLDVFDNTIGSMVWYRYSVQLENEKGAMSQVFKSEKIFPDFFDMVLSRGSKQLSVRYNYQISSFRPVVNRQKVDTLGGRYPKFVENAAMNYKQFTITGLISTQEDYNEKFKEKKPWFGQNLNNYNMYKRLHHIDEYNDYLWEREFREEVMAWLNDGEPKLYRSQTEGVLCVILSDISLTPIKELSRRIWNFSATVYEVAEGMSMSDLHALGIYNIYADGKGGDGTLGGDAPTLPQTPGGMAEIWKVGQTYEHCITDSGMNFVNGVVSNWLNERHQGILADRQVTNLYLKNVRIFFQGKPHMYIRDDNGVLRRITKEIYDDPSQLDTKEYGRILLGYRFQINTEATGDPTKSDIFVDERGFYEVPDDVDVHSLYFPDAQDTSVVHYEDGNRPECVTVNYVMVYNESDSSDKQIANTYVERTIIGQEFGTFNPFQYMSEEINKKYSYSSPATIDPASPGYFRKMTSWKGIYVDVTPFAVLQIQYLGDDSYNQYEVGHTGVLSLMPKFKVRDMCFVGVRMFLQDRSRVDETYASSVWPVYDDNVLDEVKSAHQLNEFSYLDRWECVLADADTMYYSLSEIKSPIENGVYYINGHYKIYVRGRWYDFIFEESMESGIARIPVEGSVNYIGDILLSTY